MLKALLALGFGIFSGAALTEVAHKKYPDSFSETEGHCSRMIEEIKESFQEGYQKGLGLETETSEE